MSNEKNTFNTITFNSMDFINRADASRIVDVSYLGAVGSSSKMIKNTKVLDIDTYILYLAPHKLSGYNTCAGATKECIEGCINTTGRAAMELNSDKFEGSPIINARIKKTKLFYEQRAFFFNWLIAEIEAQRNLSKKAGREFSVRLNGTSDINWAAYKHNGKTIFEYFSDVQFYDYTKVPNRFNNVPENYHLTFSYTGYNWPACKEILDMGYNVAVVFNIKSRKKNQPLPTTFKGYPVIDGDVTDYRPLDARGSIVGLKFKTIADRKAAQKILKSKFVADVNGKDCSYEILEPELVMA